MVPKTKAGACVSTVGVVYSREGPDRSDMAHSTGSMVEIADEEGRGGGCPAADRAPNLAHAADCADGIFAGRTHP